MEDGAHPSWTYQVASDAIFSFTKAWMWEGVLAPFIPTDVGHDLNLHGLSMEVVECQLSL